MSSAGEQEKAFHCKEDTMLQRLGKHQELSTRMQSI